MCIRQLLCLQHCCVNIVSRRYVATIPSAVRPQVLVDERLAENAHAMGVQFRDSMNQIRAKCVTAAMNEHRVPLSTARTVAHCDAS